MRSRFTGTALLPLLGFLMGCSQPAISAGQDEFPKVFDTQEAKPELTTAADAIEGMRLPPGFKVGLFAGEPHIRQPIALTTDERGRVWIAENYTYAEREVNFESRLKDRIVILEDTNQDGQFDNRKVFWDRASKLTSIQVGFGGVWALCAPHLLFIPDRDGDDKPDGEPVVVLDGWDGDVVRHNIVNGLRWGPDGWLYGRHGIQATSTVGLPGTPNENRTKIDCGIWRYHPTRKVFEVVARGTTNSWGMDWDDHGQLFFINTVIGHLWHVLPGAFYQRMYGEHFRSHLYELLPQSADHYHWDTAENWNDIRKLGVTNSTDAAGGGHAHCGMLIYLGDRWPATYRNSILTANLHGRRINRDLIQRKGATYVGTHGPDFLHVKDPWFRGIELITGPDGNVLLADWSDVGECHENDGVHRTSGRIYKISFEGGAPEAPLVPKDLATLGDLELVKLQLHSNDWYVRHSRRLLQERFVGGDDMTQVHAALYEMYREQSEVTRRLRAMWCLYVTGGSSDSWLIEQLRDSNEHIRVWAIQLLMDQLAPTRNVRAALEQLAIGESSGLVLTFLASALQRLPNGQRWEVAAELGGHEELAEDPIYPLMVWYGIGPAVPEDPGRAIELASKTQLPQLRRWIARRLTEEIERQPDAVSGLVALLGSSANPDFQQDILDGMVAALRGWRKAPMPEAWNGIAERLANSPRYEVKQTAKELSLVFGDGRAMDELRKIALTNNADVETRRAAVRALVAARVDGMAPLLQRLLGDRNLAADAAHGLAAYDDSDTPELLVKSYGRFRKPAREQAINAFVSRPQYARVLLGAVADGTIDRSDVSAFQLRQLQTFEDDWIDREVERLWPELKDLSAEKLTKIEEYRKALTSEALASADLSAGRLSFERTCAKCHKLYGQGGAIGPELTGAQRSNLNYLLENIVDPSATVSKNFHMSIILLDDGRVINGVVGEETERTIAVQTPTERIILARDEIDEMRPSTLSMMPERLLEVLNEGQVRDLIGYLMSPSQVPLPDAE